MHNPAEVRVALVALISATAGTPTGDRLCARLMGVTIEALREERLVGDGVALGPIVAARHAALSGLARVFQSASARLYARPDVTTVAEAFEMAGDHLELLAEDAAPLMTGTRR